MSGKEREGDGERGERGGRQGRNPLEMTALSVSVLLVAGSIGVLAWQGVRDSVPPMLETHVDSAVARGDVHYLYITVRNEGDRPAAAAQLRVRLLRDTTVVTESEAVIDWVPGRSSAGATLLFEEDPRSLEVDARVVGFTDP